MSVGTKCAQTNVHINVQINKKKSQTKKEQKEMDKANKKPLQYQNKCWINYIMTKQGPEPVENQLHPLDYNHYIDKQLQPIADAILPFTGLSFSVIIDTQLSLF